MSRESELKTKRRQLAEAEAIDTEQARQHAHELRTLVIPRMEAEIAAMKGRKLTRRKVSTYESFNYRTTTYHLIAPDGTWVAEVSVKNHDADTYKVDWNLLDGIESSKGTKTNGHSATMAEAIAEIEDIYVIGRAF